MVPVKANLESRNDFRPCGPFANERIPIATLGVIPTSIIEELPTIFALAPIVWLTLIPAGVFQGRTIDPTERTLLLAIGQTDPRVALTGGPELIHNPLVFLSIFNDQ
jgi:hypothetical protein